jgi:hypothetical protein
MMARITVGPPTPLSNIPIGASVASFIYCSLWWFVTRSDDRTMGAGGLVGCVWYRTIADYRGGCVKSPGKANWGSRNRCGVFDDENQRSEFMQIGYNNDVEHRGKTFHIQTEDRGSNDNCIETQLFQGGAILDTKITSYTDLVDGLQGAARKKKIKSLMQASHKSLFKNLLAGQYDEMVGLDPIEKPVDEVEEISEQFKPGQDRVPQEAIAIEEEGVEALETEGGESHMGLAQLKSKLAGLKEKGGLSKEAGDEETGPTTEILDAPPEMPERGFDTTPARGSRLAVVDLPQTGVSAWQGCDEPSEDLSLTDLVADHLGL